MARYNHWRYRRPKAANRNPAESKPPEPQSCRAIVNFDRSDVHIGQMNAGHKVIQSTLKYSDEPCSANVGGRIEPGLDAAFRRICSESEWSRSKGLQQALIFFVAVAPKVDYAKLVRHVDKIAPILNALE